MFLIAKLECDGLAKLAAPIEPRQIWHSDLPGDLKSAFREYIERVPVRVRVAK